MAGKVDEYAGACAHPVGRRHCNLCGRDWCDGCDPYHADGCREAHRE